MATVTLSIEDLAGEMAPLYYRAPGQSQPATARVWMTEDGEVDTGSRYDNSGTPEREWHGRTLSWTVPAEVRGDTLAALLQGEALPLLQRVHDGHSVEWDGNSRRGSLDEDAQTASDDLDRLFSALADDPTDLAQVWLVGDWLFTACTLSDHWHSQTLAEAVAEIEASARADGVVLDGDIERELLSAADRAFDADGDDPLSPVHVAELVAAGRITQQQADDRAAALAED